MDYTRIGNKIRKIRENELHLTREEFAEEIGISIDTASRLENSTHTVSKIDIFIKISELSGYTLDEILNENNFPKEKIRYKRKIDNLLKTATPEELKYIYYNIKELFKFIDKKSNT